MSQQHQTLFQQLCYYSRVVPVPDISKQLLTFLLHKAQKLAWRSEKYPEHRYTGFAVSTSNYLCNLPVKLIHIGFFYLLGIYILATRSGSLGYGD